MGFCNRVHSPKVFASIINRERDRANRTGLGFSLAVFETSNGNGKSEAARVLVPILTRKIRSTDSIGWLYDGRIGAILPHTSPDNAWRFVDHVLDACREGESHPDCAVYAYPSPEMPSTGGDPDENSRRTAARPFDAIEPAGTPGIPAWKRTMDIAGSAAGLVLLSPLMLLIALFIKAVSPGPVLFRQERMGRRGKTFTMLKFRTMQLDSDTTIHREYLVDLIRNEKEMEKLDGKADPRIIPFGSLLRALGLDELPQLVNVLLGDMSLVGPRPCLPYEALEYHPWHMRRFDVLPGLTGLWQVNGKNRTTFTEMMRFDVSYAKRKTFLLDMEIFLKTVPAVIRQAADLPAPARVRSRRNTFPS